MASMPPLDEIQHYRPDVINWHVSDGGQPMDENMIHRYLSVAPFFDPTTKNGLHFLQSETNMAEYDLVRNRQAFEKVLAGHVGSEYMIVGEPQQLHDGQTSGIWNIRKQQRDRRRDVDTGRVTEELTTLGTYYVNGVYMYQAPSVGDIVGNRLLSAMTNLSKFFDTAANLPSFSPTAGYSYLPSSTHSTTAAAGVPSADASPIRSRDGSVLPDAGLDSRSIRSTSLAPAESQLGTANHAQDSRLLAQSLRMALEFHDEYMDENPLIGEPGHFSFTSSLTAVKKRKAAEEEAAALAAKAKEQKEATATTPAVKAERAPSPPAVMTQTKEKERERERRGSKMGERVRRKKSRAQIGSLAGLPESSAS